MRLDKKETVGAHTKPFLATASGVYIITCLPQHKHYVGVSNTVRSRLTAHKSKLRRGCHENQELQHDFQVYGEHAFVFQKLLFGSGLLKTDLEKFETMILVTLPTESRYNAYTNWRKRGSTLNPFLGKTHTAEAREYQRAAKAGVPSAFAGRTQTDEVKEILRQENRGKKDRRKPLSVDGVVYESISEASEKTGYSRRTIRERCQSREERFKAYSFVPPPHPER